MKQFLVSLMTMALVIGLVSSGIFAYFSDTETSTGNTFTAATLDLQVNGQDNPGTLVEVGNLAPCVPQYVGHITLTNVGSIPGVPKIMFGAPTDTGGAAVYPVTTPVCSSEPEYVAEGGLTTWQAIDNISTQIKVDVWIDTNGDGVKDTGEDYANVDLTGAYTLDQIKGATYPIDAITLQPAGQAGSSVTIGISIHLDANAGNEFQGDVSAFDITFSLTQVGQ